MIFYGFLSRIVWSLNCNSSELPEKLVELFFSQIPYYYEDDQGLVKIKCTYKGPCTVEGEQIQFFDKQHSLSFVRNFSVGYGIYDFLNDTVQFNELNASCKHSISYCTINKNNHFKHVLWNAKNCIDSPKFRTIKAELWTTYNNTQFVTIENRSEAYLLQFRDGIEFNKTCLTSIKNRTHGEDILTSNSSNTTNYGIDDVSQNNVSKSSDIFCQAQTDKSSKYVVLIFFLTLFLIVIIIISILIYLKYLKSSRRNRELSENLKIVKKKLSVIYEEIEGDHNYAEIIKNDMEYSRKFSKDNQREEKMVENNLYSS